MQFGADELGLADVAKLAKQSKSVARRPFPGLDMMHGFMKKLQEMQMENRRQLALKNAAATPASAPSRKPALKDSTTSATSSLPQTTGSQRSTKPTLQIYRPPGARLAEMQCQQNEDIKASDTNDVQCQPSNTATDGNRVTYLKPRLNQSENRKTAINCGPMAYPKPRLDHSEVPNVLARQTPSSAHDELEPAGSGRQLHSSYERDEDSPVMYDSLIKQAMSDPTLLNSQQLQSLARVISHAASKSIGHAEPAAKFCHRIALVCKDEFLEALLRICNELFEKREELMGTHEVATDVPKRWTPYVTFVAGLLVEFESSGGDGANAASATVDASCVETPNGSWKRTVQSLAVLLSCCLQVILRPPSLGSAAEIECLRSVVTVAGQTMQRVAPHLMCALMGRLHDAYLEPSIPPRMRMVLLELIELRASGWQLKTSTQMYYNPGKAFQHHE